MPLDDPNLSAKKALEAALERKVQTGKLVDIDERIKRHKLTPVLRPNGTMARAADQVDRKVREQAEIRKAKQKEKSEKMLSPQETVDWLKDLEKTNKLISEWRKKGGWER